MSVYETLPGKGRDKDFRNELQQAIQIDNAGLDARAVEIAKNLEKEELERASKAKQAELAAQGMEIARAERADKLWRGKPKGLSRSQRQSLGLSLRAI